MKPTIKKYVQLKLFLMRDYLQYRNADYRGDTGENISYIALLLAHMDAKTIAEFPYGKLYGSGNEMVSFEIDYLDNTVEIISNLDDPDRYDYIDASDKDYHYSYTMNQDDFKKIATKWKEYYDNLEPTVYIIMLSNNRIVLQKSLTENPDIICPKRFPQYITIKYSEKEEDTAIFINHPDLHLLQSLLAIDYTPGKVWDTITNIEYNKNNKLKAMKAQNNIVIVHQDEGTETFIIPYENFKEMFNRWEDLYNEKAKEIYFILEANGSITVQDHLEKES